MGLKIWKLFEIPSIPVVTKTYNSVDMSGLEAIGNFIVFVIIVILLLSVSKFVFKVYQWKMERKR